jgi:hypothetical protein
MATWRAGPRTGETAGGSGTSRHRFAVVRLLVSLAVVLAVLVLVLVRVVLGRDAGRATGREPR